MVGPSIQTDSLFDGQLSNIAEVGLISAFSSSFRPPNTVQTHPISCQIGQLPIQKYIYHADVVVPDQSFD